MKYEIKPSSRFKRDMKLVKKRGYDQRLIENVIRTLAAGEELDKKYRDHILLGDYAGFHECHITPAAQNCVPNWKPCSRMSLP